MRTTVPVSSGTPLPPTAIFPALDPEFISFPSRRSVVHSTQGIVSCSQPLAARCGQSILQRGGNCADAAVAVAAALNVTEPGSTGIGGDMFCLFFDAETRKVHSLNGSGRAGAGVTVEKVRGALGLAEGVEGEVPMDSAHAVTIPGAAAGWVDVVERFGSGKISLSEVLEPAAELAEKGFPVSEQMGFYWGTVEKLLKSASPNGAEMLKVDPKAEGGCRAPRPGEVMRNPNLARTIRTLGKEGKAGFYKGRIAQELVKVLQDKGGFQTLEDLEHHMSVGTETTEPISLKFTGQGVTETTSHFPNGVELWEHPPNGQGLVALMALGIIQILEQEGKIPRFTPADHNSAPYLHAVIESLRLAFADANWWISDPNVSRVPVTELLSHAYLKKRADLFSPDIASKPISKGDPLEKPSTSPAHSASDTVYFCASDSAGNAISFINSNYAGFGTAIIPKGCGFTLQNRGCNFVLQPSNHPNILAPRKRPYHTIIPAAVTDAKTGELHSVFGVMGGFMQPQGHVQVLLNQLVFGLHPQAALDAPRICIGPGMPDAKDDGEVLVEDKEYLTDVVVNVEEGISEDVINGLVKMKHRVKVVKGMKRGLFGRGQIIRWHRDPVDGTGIWSAGSDPRGDGHAVPQ